MAVFPGKMNLGQGYSLKRAVVCLFLARGKVISCGWLIHKRFCIQSQQSKSCFQTSAEDCVVGQADGSDITHTYKPTHIVTDSYSYFIAIMASQTYNVCGKGRGIH